MKCFYLSMFYSIFLLPLIFLFDIQESFDVVRNHMLRISFSFPGRFLYCFLYLFCFLYQNVLHTFSEIILEIFTCFPDDYQITSYHLNIYIYIYIYISRIAGKTNKMIYWNSDFRVFTIISQYFISVLTWNNIVEHTDN